MCSRVLPVFSDEEEVEMFFHLGGFDGNEWRAKESSAGELISVLCGPCAESDPVAYAPVTGS
jgi:hypothetical protein